MEEIGSLEVQGDRTFEPAQNCALGEKEQGWHPFQTIPHTCYPILLLAG